MTQQRSEEAVAAISDTAARLAVTTTMSYREVLDALMGASGDWIHRDTLTIYKAEARGALALRDEYKARAERAEARAERAEARAAALLVKVAAVEALLPYTDEQFPIFPFQIREALGADPSGYILIPVASLAAGLSLQEERGDG